MATKMLVVLLFVHIDIGTLAPKSSSSEDDIPPEQSKDSNITAPVPCVFPARYQYAYRREQIYFDDKSVRPITFGVKYHDNINEKIFIQQLTPTVKYILEDKKKRARYAYSTDNEDCRASSLLDDELELNFKKRLPAHSIYLRSSPDGTVHGWKMYHRFKGVFENVSIVRVLIFVQNVSCLLVNATLTYLYSNTTKTYMREKITVISETTDTANLSVFRLPFSCSAAEIVSQIPTRQDNPPPCSFPLRYQYQFTMYETLLPDDRSTLRQTSGYMYHDNELGKFTLKQTLPFPQVSIVERNTRRISTYNPDRINNCLSRTLTEHELTLHFLDGIPTDAMLIENTTDWKSYRWKFFRLIENDEGVFDMWVQRNPCRLESMESILWARGGKPILKVKIISSKEMVDVDPAVFDIPSTCATSNIQRAPIACELHARYQGKYIRERQQFIPLKGAERSTGFRYQDSQENKVVITRQLDNYTTEYTKKKKVPTATLR